MHHDSSSIGQFIFFVVIVLISFISRFFTKKKGNDNSVPPRRTDWNQSPTPRPQYRPRANPQPPANPQQSEDERVRQFMDALGLPSNTPPPVRRAAAPPPLTANAPTAARRQPDFSASQRAWQQNQAEQRRRIAAAQQVLQRSQPPQPPQLAQAVRAPLKSTLAEQPEEMAVSSGSVQNVQRIAERSGKQIVAQQSSPLATAEVDVRKLMRSRDGLRAAFLMQQIFGDPRGLQSWR